MPLHWIDWRVSDGSVRAAFSCFAPPMSRCRLECAEDCGAEGWPCGYDQDHRMRDSGECHALLFLDQVYAEESYDPDAAPVPVHDGLVQVRWDGDCYVWSYHWPTP